MKLTNEDTKSLDIPIPRFRPEKQSIAMMNKFAMMPTGRRPTPILAAIKRAISRIRIPRRHTTRRI